MLSHSIRCSLRRRGWVGISLSGTFGAPGYALISPSRQLRTRAGATSHESLSVAEADEAPTSTRRAPPNAISIEYILGKIPSEAVAGRQTVDAVWAAPTIRQAWRSLYEAYNAAVEADPVRANEMRSKDLTALAMCTAHAETLHLLSLFSPPLRASITSHPLFQFADVEEFYVHLGQDIEVRGGDWIVQLPPPRAGDLQFLLRMVGRFGEDGRGCIPGTAHRVSVWRGRRGESLGVTIRVGRFVPNAARALLPLVRRGSVLILSKAGMGKTTLLRDLAASIAQEPGKPRVTVVDTSSEIGGDGPISMPFLGRCRRIHVPTRDRQSALMTEVIQNHSPEYLVVDELATADEAQAAWSISQRGVRLVATCHGDSLAGLLQNQSLNLLVGGAAQAFLSNEERRLRNKTKKTVLERPYSSPFRFVVELNRRNEGFVYVDVNRAVDLILDDQNAKMEAAVGGEARLSDDLPARLMRLIDAQDAAARKRAPETSLSSSVDSPSEDDELLFGGATVMQDEDGYVYDNGASKRARAPRYNKERRGNRGPQRKTDSQLLDELERML